MKKRIRSQDTELKAGILQQMFYGCGVWNVEELEIAKEMYLHNCICCMRQESIIRSQDFIGE